MPPDIHNLGPLLERARAGDRAAWNDLLGRLRPFIRLLVRRQLHDDVEASDVTQEAQFRMDRGFAGFRGEQVPQLLAWVRQIVARLLLDRRRPPAAVAEFPDLLDPQSSGPGSQLVREEDMTRLASALEVLPPDYRLVVEARLFDGLKCVDIAQRERRTPEWVRVTCKRAVEKLQQLLREGQ